jgi:hypothetical protein
MTERHDYARTTALAIAVVVVIVGVGLTLYWTVSARFPEITLGGWLLVCAYLCTLLAVPTFVTPLVRRTFNLERRAFGSAWRLVAFVWVTMTAIAGLLAWPTIEPYLRPFFAGGGDAP